MTLSFDMSRTVACLAVPGASTTERWQATNAPATLSVKNNLSSATQPQRGRRLERDQ